MSEMSEDVIEQKIDLAKAKKYAISLLDRRDYSRGEIFDKLLKKGATEDMADEILDRFVELGMVDDLRYAKMLVRHYAIKGYGPMRIKNELYKRKISKDLWEDAMSEMPDNTEKIDKLLNSKLKSDDPNREEIRKAADYLSRRGFSWEDISSALERYNNDEEEDVWTLV